MAMITINRKWNNLILIFYDFDDNYNHFGASSDYD